MNKIRIYIADDHAILRDGLKLIFEDQNNYEIIGETGDGESALNQIQQLKPDIVILDISMPTFSGIEVANELKRYYPEIKIIILSRHDNELYIKKLLDIGVNGYVLKENASGDLERAVEAALKEQIYLSPEITTKMLNPHRSDHPGELHHLFETLTPRERQVLKLLAEGNSNKDIATLLFISKATVKTHRINVMRKLDIHNMADLTLYAVRIGLVEAYSPLNSPASNKN